MTCLNQNFQKFFFTFALPLLSISMSVSITYTVFCIPTWYCWSSILISGIKMTGCQDKYRCKVHKRPPLFVWSIWSRYQIEFFQKSEKNKILCAVWSHSVPRYNSDKKEACSTHQKEHLVWGKILKSIHFSSGCTEQIL